MQGTDGNFYGTTTVGGAGAVPACSQFGGVGCGTVFKVTASGKETVLHSFDFYHGGNPVAGLVEATDGNFYGTTTSGGLVNGGTIFKITPTGELTTLHSFGALTYSGPVQATNGKLYGTTYSGGGYGAGSMFSLAVGLGWFVKALPNFGKEGETIHISGPNLVGATEATFNGTPAEFAVVSSSEITTTVPAGAKTGTVEVRTPPTGPLKSNLIFRVVPQITGFTPTSGAVGTTVAITGKELTQTTEVTFDGVKATLVTMDSDTTVTADVPTGANTGKIAITTPGGIARDATSFTVTP